MRCFQPPLFRFTGLLILALAALPLSGRAGPRWFAGADIQYGIIGVGGETFDPVLLRLDGGWWLRRGMAIQGRLGGNLRKDVQTGLSLKVPTLVALSLRLQSPEDLGVKAYALLGYSRFELDGSVAGSAFPGRETFVGPTVSLGFLHPLGKAKRYSVSFELNGYFADKDLDFGGIAMGLRRGY